ncbi:MAG: T9SS C-terminal target domain-containing protein [Cytophagales bacterium]|nr:MAG: T9SS C-terminal target domain-containing protein [Cytophagales bacterium]
MKKKIFRYPNGIILLFCFLYFNTTLKAQQVNFGWVNNIGATNNSKGTAIVVDAAGNTYTTGIFDSKNTFVRKYNSAGALVWAYNILAGVNSAQAYDIALDASGNLYVVGIFSGIIDFDANAGTENLTAGGTLDGFILKIDNNANFIWVKQLKGAAGASTYIRAVAIDTNNNIFTTGSVQGGNVDMDTDAGTFNIASVGGADSYVHKVNNDGTFGWVVQVQGAAGSELGIDIAIDLNTNEVVTTGYFSGAGVDFNPTAATDAPTAFGGLDIYLYKLSNAGNFVWVKSMGGTTTDIGQGVAIDAVGNIHTTGYFQGTTDFDPNAGITNLTGVSGEDVFVQKLTPAGNFVWAKEIVGAGTQDGKGIAIDSENNVYTCGHFGSNTDFDPSANVYSQNTTVIKGFLHKLDSNGEFVWVKTFGTGSTNSNEVWALSVDNTQAVYVIGFTKESNVFDFDLDPTAPNSYISFAGSEDAYAAKYTQTIVTMPIGNRGLYFEGTENDRASALGNATVVDFTGTENFSVSFWVKPRKIGTSQAVFTKQGGGGNPLGIAVYINNTGQIVFGLDKTGVGWHYTTSTTSINANVWTHITVVKQANNKRIYLNGILDQEETGIVAPYLSADPCTGDIVISTAADPFYGQIDELRIYNASVSKPQIQTLMADDKSSNAVVFYRFENASGQNVNNLSLTAVPALTLGSSGTSETDDPLWAFRVKNSLSTGTESFADVIGEANSFSGTHYVDFSIDNSNVTHNINISAAINITESIVIDGYSAPFSQENTLTALSSGTNASLKIVISAGSVPIDINSSSSCVIRGIVFNNFTSSPLRLSTGSNHILAGCFIGTNSVGSAAAMNGGTIPINASNTTIGGSNPADRNLFVGHTLSIDGSGNTITNNLVGTNTSANHLLNTTPISIIGISSNTISITNNYFNGGGVLGTFIGTAIESNTTTGNGLTIQGNIFGENSSYNETIVFNGNTTNIIIGGTSGTTANIIKNSNLPIHNIGSPTPYVRQNSIYCNSNNIITGINAPTILSAYINGSSQLVLDIAGVAVNDVVDIYVNGEVCSPKQGNLYRSAFVANTGSGTYLISSSGVAMGNTITIATTNTSNQSSAFSGAIIVSTSPTVLRAATNHSNNSFRANWDLIAGASSYEIDVATDVGFSTVIINALDVGNTTSYNITGLDANTLYYYRVRAVAGGVASSDSQTRVAFTNTSVGSGYAGNFDGSSQFFHLTDTNSYNFQFNEAFSIEAWIYPTANNGVIVSKMVDTPFNRGWALKLNATGQLEISLVGFSTIAYFSLNTTTNIPLNQWSSVAMTYDGSNTASGISLYLNGVPQPVTNAGNGVVSEIKTPTPLSIGAANTNLIPNGFFSGVIDEVRVWAGVRSIVQIRNTMCQRLQGNEAGLVGYFQVNEVGATLTHTENKASNSTYDAVWQNPHNATLSGAALGDVSTAEYALGINNVVLNGQGIFTVELPTALTLGQGVHIYRIDQITTLMDIPTEIETLKTSPYWGIFTVGNVPEYSIRYNYTANTNIAIIERNAVNFMHRNDNSIQTTWTFSNATNETALNRLSLTLSGVTQREFIIGLQPFSAVPPAVPTNLTANAASINSIQLNWTDNSTTETSFILQRSLSSTTGFTDLITLNANTTTYTDPNLTTNTTYYYRIFATNGFGNSPLSNEAFATPVLDAPTNLIVDVAGTDAQIIWQDNIAGENHYEIERSINDLNNFIKITDLPPNTNTFTDKQLSKNQTLYYRVRAYANNTYSPYSNVQGCILAEEVDWVTDLEEAEKAGIKLYPNPLPSNTLLQIQTPPDINIENIALYQTTGELVWQKNTSHTNPISLASLIPNLYIIVLTDQQGRKYTQRILKF